MNKLSPVLCMVVAVCSFTVVSMTSRCPPDARTCSECVQRNANCSWCSGEMLGGGSRCALPSTLAFTCSEVEDSTLYMKRWNLIITVYKQVKSKRPIGPQRMELSMRLDVNGTVDFEVFTRKKAFTLKLRHPRAVEVDISSQCNGFERKNKVITCKDITSRKTKFTMTVRLKRCLPKPKRIKVTVDGNKKRTLKIKLRSICSCDCEKPERTVLGSNMCSGRGSLACGVCSCDQGYYGRMCECDPTKADPTACSPPGSTDVCSNRGECVCGVCNCFALHKSSSRRYTGRHCECNDYSCAYYEGELCGGKERGVCRCGQCMCSAGYIGEACEISLSTDNCMSSSGKMCNGHGECINNICRCRELYRGHTCEDCPTCPSLCQELKPYVQCDVFGTGTLMPEECEGQLYGRNYRVEPVDTLNITGQDTRRCRFRDEDDCLVSFVYKYSRERPTQTEILVQRTKECPWPEV